MNETSTPETIHVGKPDWLSYQRLFETVGGVGGYLQLKQQEPQLLKLILESFGIDLEKGERP